MMYLVHDDAGDQRLTQFLSTFGHGFIDRRRLKKENLINLVAKQLKVPHNMIAVPEGAVFSLGAKGKNEHQIGTMDVRFSEVGIFAWDWRLYEQTNRSDMERPEGDLSVDALGAPAI